MRIVLKPAIMIVLLAAILAPSMLDESAWRPIVAASVVVAFMLGLWCGSR